MKQALELCQNKPEGKNFIKSVDKACILPLFVIELNSYGNLIFFIYKYTYLFEEVKSHAKH